MGGYDDMNPIKDFKGLVKVLLVVGLVVGAVGVGAIWLLATLMN